MTEAVTKAPRPSIKWACITLHDLLPARSTQIAGARAWGAEPDMHQGMDISTTYTDDVRGMRTTNWPAALPQRALLFDALQVNRACDQQVFFRSPLCVGFSERHMRETLAGIWATGAMVYIWSEGVLLREGDDLAEIEEAREREYNAARMRRSRARAKKARQG